MNEEEKNTEVVEEENTEVEANNEEEKQAREPEEEMIPKSEAEKMIKDRVRREQKAREKAVEEAEKLAKMNAEQKKEYEYEKMQKELEEYKQKDQFYKLSREASKMLADEDIKADDELLETLVKDDAEGTQQAVQSFVKLLNAKVEEGVKKALSGNSPRVNAGNNIVSKKQIMEIKDPVERQKAIRENINLFN